MTPSVSKDQEQQAGTTTASHYHPLLKKEKEMFSIIQRIIPLIQKICAFTPFWFTKDPREETSDLSDAVGDRNLQLQAS